MTVIGVNQLEINRFQILISPVFNINVGGSCFFGYTAIHQAVVAT